MLRRMIHPAIRHALRLLWLAGCVCVPRGNAEPDTAITNANLAWVTARLAEDRAAQAQDRDRFVALGLSADRRTREVRLWADATGIQAHDPLEFLLVAEGSGHGYETLAVSHARPSDVDAALRFVGLTPGRPASPGALSFWPKGERVMITASTLGSNGWSAPLPAEHLLWDDRASAPFSPAGFVYVDAGRTAPADSLPESVFVPDVYTPRAIISLYNASHTVLDVPTLAPQGSVYGSQRANPDTLMPEGTLIEFTLSARAAIESPRVRDFTLQVLAPTNGPRPGDAVFQLSPPPSETEGPWPRAGLDAEITRLVRAGLDPFVRITFAPELRLDEAQAAAQYARGLEGTSGIRIEAPPDGHLFFRAFTPEEQFRRREDRVAQPFELHLARHAETVTAALIHIEERWSEERTEPELIPTEYPLANPAALEAKLKASESLPVLLVFAPPDLHVSDVMAYVQPVLGSHPLIHIFLTPAVTPDQISAPAP